MPGQGADAHGFAVDGDCVEARDAADVDQVIAAQRPAAQLDQEVGAAREQPRAVTQRRHHRGGLLDAGGAVDLHGQLAAMTGPSARMVCAVASPGGA